jgi:hypothetical protein
VKATRLSGGFFPSRMSPILNEDDCIAKDIEESCMVKISCQLTAYSFFTLRSF